MTVERAAADSTIPASPRTVGVSPGRELRRAVARDPLLTGSLPPASRLPAVSRVPSAI